MSPVPRRPLVNHPVLKPPGLLLGSVDGFDGSGCVQLFPLLRVAVRQAMGVRAGACDSAPRTHAYQPRWLMSWDAWWSACSAKPHDPPLNTAREGRSALAT